MSKYIIACVHEWNIQFFQEYFGANSNFVLISKPEELTIDRLDQVNPRYIFFPHWSWIVPDDIVQKFECICFHMTDLPYGRGGSPLQNLILHKKQETMLSVIKMTSVLDEGPIYMKVKVSLKGRAEEIYRNVSRVSFDLIKHMVEVGKLTHYPQSGQVVKFRRRKPSESELFFKGKSLEDVYDFIRMLDSPGYPHAFINIDNFKISFSHVSIDQKTKSINGNFKLSLRGE
ncbi:MAG: methionyl-tRNA formyltransferase [Halobacteriovorax sp.]|nr:methionyl-tRNA formyltransferase [Halobacteriovorax sp.]